MPLRGVRNVLTAIVRSQSKLVFCNNNSIFVAIVLFLFFHWRVDIQISQNFPILCINRSYLLFFHVHVFVPYYTHQVVCSIIIIIIMVELILIMLLQFKFVQWDGFTNCVTLVAPVTIIMVLIMLVKMFIRAYLSFVRVGKLAIFNAALFSFYLHKEHDGSLCGLWWYLFKYLIVVWIGLWKTLKPIISS